MTVGVVHAILCTTDSACGHALQRNGLMLAGVDAGPKAEVESVAVSRPCHKGRVTKTEMSVLDVST